MLWSIVRISIGETLVRLGVALMPPSHPHRAVWQESVKRAETMLNASP